MSKELREQFEKETKKSIWNKVGYSYAYGEWLESKLKESDQKNKELGGLFNPNPVEELNKIIEETFPDTDSEGYDLDEDGNRLSCCGDVLDPEFMICPTCKEHC